jgi:hypothetical protein
VCALAPSNLSGSRSLNTFRSRSVFAKAATGVGGAIALFAIAGVLLWSVPSYGTAGVAASTQPNGSPSSGIAEGRAVELATPYAPLGSVEVSARSGAFSALNPDTSFVPDQVTPDRIVWAVTFTAIFNICPPPGPSAVPAPSDRSACVTRPGTTTVILDFVTGDFIEGYGYSPPE